MSLTADFITVAADLALAHAVATFADGRTFAESGDATPDNVDEAALVQRIFWLYVEGGRSMYAIAALLTAEGIPTPHDRKHMLTARVWHPATIANMLHNTAYIGTLYDGKTQRLPDRKSVV